MVIQEIIAIAGKPGLYRILATNRNNLVVESMLDKKRLSIPSASRISSLSDITMYTTGEDILLLEVLNRINEKTGKEATPNAKDDMQKIRDFVDAIIPELDHERVYNSDIKKLIQWFNLLRENQAFPLTSESEKEQEEGDSEKTAGVSDDAHATKTKKAPAKKAAPKKAVSSKATSKKAPLKKSPVMKTTTPKGAAKGR